MFESYIDFQTPLTVNVTLLENCQQVRVQVKYKQTLGATTELVEVCQHLQAGPGHGLANSLLAL